MKFEQPDLFEDAGHAPKDSRSPEDAGGGEPASAAPAGARMVWVGPSEELTRRAAGLLEGLRLPGAAAKVLVYWNKRMRSAAGRAFFTEMRIELNPRLQLLEPPGREEEIERTFLHELAHLVAAARHPGRRMKPHGPEWRKACADLGIPGESRCHDLAFASRRMKRKYRYECPQCGDAIHRVRRMSRRAACYRCCREYSGGRFDDRFALVELRLREG